MNLVWVPAETKPAPVNILLKSHTQSLELSQVWFLCRYFVVMIRVLLADIFFLLILLGIQPLFAQDEIEWVTFEEALQRAPQEQKKIMVDIHTERCRWCIVMNEKTYKNPDVVRYVNLHYIAVRFNAEDSGPIQYKGKTYSMSRQGKRNCHELATEIMRGRISYPTVVFLDEQLNVIQPLPGYRDAEQYLMVLRYYGENFHHHTPWDKFVERHSGKQAHPVGGR